MKKSIAFLGALLFGSVTFGQVTKNDSIKKPASRKVSADDLKKFPVDTEATATDGHIKIESSQKVYPKRSGEKHTSDASAGKGSMTQKGKAIISAATTEKMHYTVKLTNANKKANPDATEQTDNGDGEATTQKKHVSNVKWTPGNVSIGNKVAVDSTSTQSKKSTPTQLKGGMIQKGKGPGGTVVIEK